MPRTINTAIEAVPLNLLKPHPRNVNQGDFGAIQQSVETNGFYGTIVANKRTGHILAGNHRYAVAKAMHYTDVPVAWVDVDDEQELRILIADNRTTRLGIDNEASLTELLAELAATPTGLTGTGFDGDDLDALISSVTGADKAELLTDPDDVPEDAPTRCNPGDLWQLGDHRLLCGDSTKAEDVQRLMAGAKAGMMVTDPPYGVDYDGGQANAKKREKLSGDDTTEVFDAGLSAALNAVPSGAWYIWHAGRYAEPVYAAIRKCGFDVRALIVWNKLKAHYGAPSAHYCQKHEPCLYAVKDSAGFCGPSNEVTVWDIEQPHRNEHHPTQKPIICMARAIRNHQAESVYDPFLGSGTTLIAAEQLGRKCYGIEISPKYCDVIIERWERATGKTAVLLEAGNGTTD